MGKLIRMHLVMAVGNKVIARITVDPDLAKNGNYLATCRGVLEEKHWLTLVTYLTPPQFYLETPSAMGSIKKKRKG